MYMYLQPYQLGSLCICVFAYADDDTVGAEISVRRSVSTIFLIDDYRGAPLLTQCTLVHTEFFQNRLMSHCSGLRQELIYQSVLFADYQPFFLPQLTRSNTDQHNGTPPHNLPACTVRGYDSEQASD